MSTKIVFSAIALLAWMISFCVIVVSALADNFFFLHDTYQQKLFIVALINMICLVWLIYIPAWQAAKGGE